MLRAGCTLAPDKLVGVETKGVTGDQVLDFFCHYSRLQPSALGIHSLASGDGLRIRSKYRAGEVGQSPRVLLLSWLLAVSIAFSPLTKIHQAAMLAHHFCFSMVVGCGTNTLRIHTAIIFSARCKHFAMAEYPAPLQEHKQHCHLLHQACTALIAAAIPSPCLGADHPCTTGICSAFYCSHTPGYASSTRPSFTVVTHCQKPQCRGGGGGVGKRSGKILSRDVWHEFCSASVVESVV